MNLLQRAPTDGLSVVLAKAIIESGLSDLRIVSPPLGLQAEEPTKAAFNDAMAADATILEAQEAANRVFEEFEGRVPEWRARQARERNEREQEISRMCAAQDFTRALTAARYSPKNSSDIVAEVEKCGFRLRLADNDQLQIAPPSGVPVKLRAYVCEFQEQIVGYLKNRENWGPIG
jgi:hypothetical protein